MSQQRRRRQQSVASRRASSVLTGSALTLKPTRRFDADLVGASDAANARTAADDRAMAIAGAGKAPDVPLIATDDIASSDMPNGAAISGPLKSAEIIETPGALDEVDEQEEDVTRETLDDEDGYSAAPRTAGDRWQATLDWLKRRTWEQWAWVGVLGLAFILRFWDLGYKALHHDESMHAFYSLLFARDPSSYAYNPLLHGPFQFHAEGFMFMLLLGLSALFHVGGPGNQPWINDTTARIVPALFGWGIVALPIGLRRELTRLGALIAAFLLAVSPSFVYFSRFLREDIYFNFFMFAMVVCAVRFATSRRMIWLALTAAATSLAYATFEGIFLTLVIFLSFLAALFVWELAVSFYRYVPLELPDSYKLLFTRAVLLVILTGVGAIAAELALNIIHRLNAYINGSQKQANAAQAQLLNLEHVTVSALLYLSIFAALLVIAALLWQLMRDNAAYARYERMQAQAAALENGEDLDIAFVDEEPEWRLQVEAVISAPGRFATWLRDKLDVDHQPFLRLLLGVSWTQWFVAIVTGWLIFVALFWEFPGAGRTIGQGFEEGIGNGVWDGLYYWIQQQNVARGAQPIYYYFLLIPLYEQLAVVLGLAGVIYALARPTKFRIFLVWWFVGSLGIYSWAGEKMPWLTIHILLSLMLLAAIAINRAIQGVVVFVKELRIGINWKAALTSRAVASIVGVVAAVLLLIPMVHSMYTLAYVDPSNGPLEMMVYVQTTQDVDTVMQKIALADQHLYDGKHQLRIVVGQGEEWPMYWYLRDYWLDPHPSEYVMFDPTSAPGANPFIGMNPDALILYPGTQVQQFFQAHPTGYSAKEYVLRSWFDEGYKPAQCVPTSKTKCPPAQDPAFYGEGLGTWLTYGSNPPANPKFNLGTASSRLWNWLWYRKPLGAVSSQYYDFVFIVKDSAGVKP